MPDCEGAPVFCVLTDRSLPDRVGIHTRYSSMVAKRSTIGRPRALTQEQVDLILAWHAQRKTLKTLRQLAAELGVAPATVHHVIRHHDEFKKPPRDFREAELRAQDERSPKRKRPKRKGPR